MVIPVALEWHHLDSSVCIEIMRKKNGPDAVKLPSLLAISTIVESELRVGVEKQSEPEKHLRKLEAFLEVCDLVPYDSLAAQHYGEIRAELERKGQKIGPMDLLIAAHARSCGATLLTCNTKEFRRVKGLKLKTWK